MSGRPPLRRWLPPVALGLLVLACSGGTEPPRALPPQSMSPLEADSGGGGEEPGALPSDGDGEAPATGPTADDSVVVVDDPAATTGRPVSLVEAARAERARRGGAVPPAIVITDENLADYATGKLTVAEPAPTAAGEDGGAEPAEGGDDGDRAATDEAAGGDDETFWRTRVLALRLDWRAAAARVEELGVEIAELRQRFYAEDDGFYRDAQIKPAWDRALDQRQEARRDVERHREELATVLEEGRRAGALPGWLREGIEHEPEPEPGRSDIHEPGEPTVVGEEERP